MLNKEQFKRVGDILYNERTISKEIIQTTKLANGDMLLLCVEKVAETGAVKLYWCSAENVSR